MSTRDGETDSTTVLVVDDETALADLYAVWLEDTYRVRTAYGGEEALGALDETVDVVLLDRKMPDITGDEVLARLRERGLDCRVALVTAVDPDFDILELGFDSYVTKPVERDDLHEAVETLLRRRTYSERVREYFTLVEKKATLETAKSDDELGASEEYATLVAEVEALGAEVDRLLDTFDDEDFVVLFREPGGPRQPAADSTFGD